MGLDMYLERMPRYEDTTATQVSAIEDYLQWKHDRENPESPARKYTFKQWCGRDYKDVPKGKVLKFYKEHAKYAYASWDTEQKYNRRYRLLEEVGYWRKANQIHNWFVEHVQDGEDDCRYHNEVTKEDLEELLDLCEKIKSIAVMESAPIETGYSYSNGKMTPIYEDGALIVNVEKIAALLPRTSGFFFGGDGYDSYYMQDIENTIDIITKVLETTDFETQMVYYVSSW